MDAKRPRIENGLRGPPTTQFFPPYPEDEEDEDDEEKDNKLGGLAGDQSSDRNNEHFDKGEVAGKSQHHKCIVCDRECVLTEMIPFTTDQQKRIRWINSVRWTSEGRRSLMEQLIATKSPFLCASHFLPTDFNHDSSHIDLRPDAVPLFVGSSAQSNKAVDPPREVPSDIKEELMEIKEEPIDEFADIKEEEPITEMDSIDSEVAMNSIKSFVCPECGKILFNKHSFVAHMRVHTGRKVSMCDLCDMFFPTGQLLNSHVKNTHEKKEPKHKEPKPKKSYSCSECGKNLSCKVTLDDHLRIHSGEKPFKCPHCDLSFHGKSTRFKHIKSLHLVQGDATTSEVENVLLDIHNETEEPMKDEPIDKFADVKDEEPIVDIYCPSTGTSRPLDQPTPMEMDRSEVSDKSFICSECGQKLSNNQRLKDHMRIHTGEKPYVCPHCYHSFHTQTNLVYHIRAVHKLQPYACATCDEQFDLKIKLTQHLFTNKGHIELKHDSEATSYDKAFHDIVNESTEDSLKEEPIDEFADVKQEEPMVDMYCPSTGRSRTLDQYTPMEFDRSEVSNKSFICSECGKNLSSKYNLKLHMRIHSGEKPFPCSHCDKSFRDVFIRIQHIRMVHKKQPYACLTCGEQFVDKMGLRVHIFKNKEHVENDYRSEVNEMSHMEEEPSDEESNNEEPGPSRRC